MIHSPPPRKIIFLAGLFGTWYFRNLSPAINRNMCVRKPSFERTTGQAQTRVAVLVLALILLGVAAGAFWYFRRGREHGTTKNTGAAAGVVLSESTKAVLKNLDSAVEIHFYSLLDQASVPASTFAFADRINQLLAEYQREGGGKISVTFFKASSDANAASAEGLKPFNLDKGDACYLGLSVSYKAQKQSFPQLSAEWEQALEFDLSRAIARLAETPPTPNSPASSSANSSATDSTSIDDLKHAIPNLASVSVTEGTQLLRQEALQNFKTAAAEMEVQVKEAQQRLIEAQNGKSEAAQRAAMKHFQQVQAEQAEKLRQIAARLQSQIATLEQIKKP